MNVIGIAIGGTKTAVTLGIFDENNVLLSNEKKVFETNPNSYDNVFLNICYTINSFNITVDFISVICGGPLDIYKGTINKPPHLPGFDNCNIVNDLKNKYHCKVSLLNDADASALAELYYGAGKNSQNMAFCTFGTGFGSGLIFNRKLYTGNNGMAGEIGHVKLTNNGPVGYGVEGSVEGWCAGGNIPKWANLNVKNTKELFELAKGNNKDALKAIDVLVDKLAQTISILIDILNLDTVIIGGIYPRNLDLLENKLIKSISEKSISFNYQNCKVLPSLLGEKLDEYSSLMGYVNDMNTNNLYVRYPSLVGEKENIEQAIETLKACYKNGGKILVCGNGGSASDASHIVGELMKGFMLKRETSLEVDKKLQEGIPAIDLGSQQGLITAFANDVDPELIFAQQVLGYSKNCPNDVVIGLSTSGNSKNVVKAFETAKSLGLKTIALTGKKESCLSKIASITIKVPEEETYKVQELHLPVYHYICMELERILFKK